MRSTQTWPLWALPTAALALVLSACTQIAPAIHTDRSESLPAHTFEYQDGGSSVYYTFAIGDATQRNTAVFFYGATGCPSWGSVMPGYVQGLETNAQVFVLNKRFVVNESTGDLECGRDFHLANHPDQWAADYSEFITTQVAKLSPAPKHVVLVGVSEGAWPAARVAANTPATHLAIIGSGGYSMRRSLKTLQRQGHVPLDVDTGWQDIATDPTSIDKEWFGNPYRWWSEVMDLDPMPVLLELDIPILVGIGEQDQSEPVESVLFLQQAFEQAGKDNLKTMIYPQADHRLNAIGIAYRPAFFKALSDMLEPN